MMDEEWTDFEDGEWATPFMRGVGLGVEVSGMMSDVSSETSSGTHFALDGNSCSERKGTFCPPIVRQFLERSIIA